MRTTILLAALAVTGCTTIYDKPGLTEREFQADYAQCKFEEAKVIASASYNFVQTCMRAKGYTPRRS